MSRCRCIHVQSHACECMHEGGGACKGREKGGKNKSPVRWSGLISEISSAKEFCSSRLSFLRYSSLSLSLPPYKYTLVPYPFLLFLSFHRPRGNLRALLTSAIIVLTAASRFIFIFIFQIPRFCAHFNNRREEVQERRLFSLLLHPPPPRRGMLFPRISPLASLVHLCPFPSPSSRPSTFSFNPRRRPHGIPRDFELCYSFSHLFSPAVGPCTLPPLDRAATMIDTVSRIRV